MGVALACGERVDTPFHGGRGGTVCRDGGIVKVEFALQTIPQSLTRQPPLDKGALQLKPFFPPPQVVVYFR